MCHIYTCYVHIHVHDIVCTLVKALLFQGVRSINGRIYMYMYIAHKEMYTRATVATTNRTVYMYMKISKRLETINK